MRGAARARLPPLAAKPSDTFVDDGILLRGPHRPHLRATLHAGRAAVRPRDDRDRDRRERHGHGRRRRVHGRDASDGDKAKIGPATDAGSADARGRQGGGRRGGERRRGGQHVLLARHILLQPMPPVAHRVRCATGKARRNVIPSVACERRMGRKLMPREWRARARGGQVAPYTVTYCRIIASSSSFQMVLRFLSVCCAASASLGLTIISLRAAPTPSTGSSRLGVFRMQCAGKRRSGSPSWVAKQSSGFTG